MKSSDKDYKRLNMHHYKRFLAWKVLNFYCWIAKNFANKICNSTEFN